MTVPNSSGQIAEPGDLRKLMVFRDLDDAGLRAIARWLTVTAYCKDQEIFGQFEQDDGVYFILSGTVRITVFSAAGKEVTFRDLEAGGMFGELSAIDGQPRSTDAIAKIDARVGRVSTAQFWELLQEFPGVNAAILRYLSALVRDLSDRVFQFSAYAVSNRIQSEILRLAESTEPAGNQTSITPAPTHAEIASRVNTHREAVTKEISRLVRIGLLVRAPGTLKVKDLAGLRALAEEIGD